MSNSPTPSDPDIQPSIEYASPAGSGDSTTADIGVIGLRLLGLFLTLKLLTLPVILLSLLLSSGWTTDELMIRLSWPLSEFLLGVSGVLLFVQTRWFADRVLAGVERTSLRGISSSTVMTIAVGAAGAYLACISLPQVVSAALQIALATLGIGRWANSVPMIEGYFITNLVGWSLQLAAGVTLFLFARRLGDLALKKLQ